MRVGCAPAATACLLAKVLLCPFSLCGVCERAYYVRGALVPCYSACGKHNVHIHVIQL